MSCNIQKRRQMAAAAQADLSRTRTQMESIKTPIQAGASTLQTPLQKMLAEREKQDTMWTESSNHQNQESTKPTNSSKSIERYG